MCKYFIVVVKMGRKNQIKLSKKREVRTMAGRIVTQKTLFLDEKDYNIFVDFSFLITDLASNLDDKDIDELQEAIEQFVERINVEMEGE